MAETFYRKLKLLQWGKQTGEWRSQWIEALQNLNWMENREDFQKLITLAKYDWGAAWDPQSWLSLESKFEELQRLSVKNNFRVLVLCFPVAFQVYTQFLDDRPQKILESKSTELRFEYLNLLPVLRAHQKERFYFDQCHANAAANEWIGKAVARFIGLNMIQPAVHLPS